MFGLVCQQFEFTISSDQYDELFLSIDRQLKNNKLLIASVGNCPEESITPEEFSYLTEISPNSFIDAQILKKALFYLWKKGKFSAITARLEPSNDAYEIYFQYVPCYVVNAVKIHGGLLVGRDRFGTMYGIERGDRFDIGSHEHGVLNIYQELHKQGFFNAVINQRLDYDEKAYQVTVHLSPSRGKQFSIGEIDLLCVPQVETSSVLAEQLYANCLNKLKGESFDNARLNNAAAAMKKYLASQGWLQASIKLTQSIKRDRSQVDLRFTIDLHQKKEIIFLGNHHFSDDQLLEQLRHFGGELLVPASILSEEIAACYYKAGFLQAQIKNEEADDKIHFLIHEGPRAQIARITFNGVTHFDHQKLIKKTGGLALEGKYVEQPSMQGMFKNCIDLYRREGFWHARIVAHECKPTENPEWYDLVITIEQGKRSTIDQVRLTMPAGQTTQPGIDMPGVGALLTPEALVQQERYLQKQYPAYDFRPEITHDDERAQIIWQGQSVKTASFGKTVITGSSKIPFEYIMRELRYKQGQEWDPLKVRRSMVALKELDIFDSISIFPYQQPVPFDERPMILKIIPDDPFELRTRMGMGFEYAGKELTYKGVTYKLGGAMVFKNPFNYADYFFANADFTRTHRIMEAGYWRPWLFGYPVQTLMQLYNNAFEYPGIIGSQRNLYKVRQAGGLLGLVNKWDALQAGVNIGFECMETTISNKRPQEGLFNRLVARAINFEPALLDKWVPYFLLEPTCFINTVDNQLYPTCGFITLCSIKGMIPVGSLDKTFFIKLMAEQSVFVPLWPTVLALRLRFGHILYQQFNNIMPSERFYLGGANSIRSYQTDMCPPLGVLPNPPGQKKNFVPQGGKSMLNGNLEIRFPVYKELWAAVFQDFGFLHGGNNLADLVKAGLLAGTGFGLRYNTPIGPLRFDIGFKWKKPDPALHSFAWFLTLGQPF